MAKAKRLVIPLLILGTFLLSGAREQTPPSTSQSIMVDFVSQPIPVASTIPLTGPDLLRAACGILDPDKMPWLKTTIWQQMTDGDLTFVAQAQLHLGPHGCARMDMTIHTSRTTTQHLVVSDGHALAQYTRNTRQSDDVEGIPFPRGPKNMDPQKQQALRHAFLREKGCGGPRAILLNLAVGLTEIAVDLGLWRGQPAVRFQGKLADPQAAPAHVCGYLDAQTMWPLRLEWRHLTRKGLAPFPYLQMEFRDPVLNQPLSFEECSRVFTFQPVNNPD